MDYRSFSFGIRFCSMSEPVRFFSSTDVAEAQFLLQPAFDVLHYKSRLVKLCIGLFVSL